MKRYVLEYSKDPFQKTSFILEDETTLGRSRTNTIFLDEPEISRLHAKITYEGGQWILRDLQSQNGTFVNDARIKRKALKKGDKIRLGPVVTLRFLELESRENLRSLMETVELVQPLGLPQEIQDKMELVRTFMDALPIGVAILNQGMEVRFYNHALSSFIHSEGRERVKQLGLLLGCSLQAPEGVACGSVEECKRCALQQAVSKAFEQKAPTLEKEMLWLSKKNTSSAYVRFSLFPLSYRLTGEQLAMLTWENITLHKLTLKKLLRDADTAMYRAKSQGRARHVIFDAGMQSNAMKVLKLKAELRRAIERHEFVVHYQPIICLKTQRVTGVEALLRWQHPQNGLVYPSEFIPDVEESGLITSIGEWVLKTACEQIRSWHQQGIDPLYLTVNLSGRQFRQQNLIGSILRVLERTNLPPHILGLEITESSLMEGAEENIKMLREFHKMGIRLYIDDFGTGYSSLAYLKRFPLNTIKIDRSFVRDITTNSDDAAIATTIIAMAQSLRMKVIAEGVETEAQLDLLRSLNCDEIQGYLFSRPLPAERLTEKLKRGLRLPKRTKKNARIISPRLGRF